MTMELTDTTGMPAPVARAAGRRAYRAGAAAQLPRGADRGGGGRRRRGAAAGDDARLQVTRYCSSPPKQRCRRSTPHWAASTTVRTAPVSAATSPSRSNGSRCCPPAGPARRVRRVPNWAGSAAVHTAAGLSPDRPPARARSNRLVKINVLPGACPRPTCPGPVRRSLTRLNGRSPGAVRSGDTVTDVASTPTRRVGHSREQRADPRLEVRRVRPLWAAVRHPTPVRPLLIAPLTEGRRPMTTADTALLSRRQGRQQTRDHSRPRGHQPRWARARAQQLLHSLKTVGCVALTLFFLRLGIPGPAFVFLAVGVLLLSRSHAG